MRTNVRLILSIGVFTLLAGAFASTASTPAAAQAATRVSVGDLWFCGDSFQNGVCETRITAGDTIVWDFSEASATHTTTACGPSCDDPTASPLWDSGRVSDGGTFQFTFDEPGTYLYRCNIHTSIMRGRIIVGEAAAPPTEQPGDEEPDAPDDGVTEPDTEPTADPEIDVTAPSTGAGPGPSSSPSWSLLSTLAAVGVGLVTLSAAVIRVGRRS